MGSKFLAGVFLIALTIYALPTAIELALLRASFSPMGCMFIGDLLGCGVLFFLGFRKTALGIYVTATALEASCLRFHVLPSRSVILATNVAPAVALCGIFAYLVALDDRSALE